MVNARNHLESSSFQIAVVGMNNFSTISCYSLALKSVSNYHVVIVSIFIHQRHPLSQVIHLALLCGYAAPAVLNKICVVDKIENRRNWRPLRDACWCRSLIGDALGHTDFCAPIRQERFYPGGKLAQSSLSEVMEQAVVREIIVGS